MAGERKASIKLIENILTSGTYNALEINKRSRLMILNAIIVVGVVLLTLFGIIGVRDSDVTKVIVGYSCFVVTAIILVIFFYMRIRKKFAIGNYFISILMFLFFGVLTITGGSDSSGVLWMQSYSLISIFLLGERVGLFLALLFLAGTGTSLFLDWPVDIGYSIAFKIRVVGVYIFITLFSLTFERIRVITQKRIERSRNELAETAKQLQDSKVQTDSIMENVQEGIFILDNQLKISSEYSKYLEEILERDNLENEYFIDCISNGMKENEVKGTVDYLEMFFDESVDQELLKEINPIDKLTLAIPLSDGTFHEKHLEFRFDDIYLEEKGKMILATVSDVTESVNLSKKLREESLHNTRKMETLFQIIQISPDLLNDFIQDTEKELFLINRLLKNSKSNDHRVLEKLFQSVHSIKGNAVLIGLKSFSEKIHRIEDEIVLLRSKKDIVWNDILLITIELSKIQKDIEEIKNLINEILSFHTDLSTATDEDPLLKAIKNLADEVSRETGKEVDLDFSDFRLGDIPEEFTPPLKDILVQLVRNSITHGIEDSETRISKGKKKQGQITVSSIRTNDRVKITYKDDGRGLDLQKILAKAKSRKAFKGYNLNELSSSKVLGLIFHSGFSTQDESTMSAGRGVGMSLVKDRVESSGGKINVKSITGKAFIFEFFFPCAAPQSHPQP